MIPVRRCAPWKLKDSGSSSGKPAAFLKRCVFNLCPEMGSEFAVAGSLLHHRGARDECKVEDWEGGRGLLGPNPALLPRGIAVNLQNGGISI